MADRVSVEKRSQIMRSVGTRNTGPELLVRSAAHRLGLRFRLHDKTLPGTPDMVLPKRKTVVFVNGCYWHRHEGCAKATFPKSNRKFWRAKFESNVARDARNCAALHAAGWRIVVIWQCEAKTLADATATVTRKFRLTRAIPKSGRARARHSQFDR